MRYPPPWKYTTVGSSASSSLVQRMPATPSWSPSVAVVPSASGSLPMVASMRSRSSGRLPGGGATGWAAMRALKASYSALAIAETLAVHPSWNREGAGEDHTHRLADGDGGGVDLVDGAVGTGDQVAHHADGGILVESDDDHVVGGDVGEVGEERGG